jgi:hypothetical protein
MKALTIYQPQASLIAIGAKEFETRSRRISYRGPLAIHAGLKKPSDALAGVGTDAILAMSRAFGMEREPIGIILKRFDALPREATSGTGSVPRQAGPLDVNGGCS